MYIIILSLQFTDGNDTFAKSGNPGYLIGKNILYGTLTTIQNADSTESYPFFTGFKISIVLQPIVKFT